MLDQIRYTKTYEYIMTKGNKGTVGISAEASDKLGDIYLVDLPSIGQQFKKDQEVAVIESVKSAADVYCPVSGKIIEVNSILESKPELVSKNPLNKGWLFKIEIFNKSELDTLMEYDEFKKFINEEG